MANVLITGGTGFIGSRLAITCQSRGDAVTVVGQRNTQAESENWQELESLAIQVLEGSVTNLGALRDAFGGIDVVYHLAAAQHEANVDESHFYQVNVEGTRNVLQLSADAGVSRFVHGSTIGVYGIGRNGQPVSDDSPLTPDNIYGVTKLAGERLVREFADKLPVVIARISETYGPGDRRLLKLFKGIQKRTFFHVGEGLNLHHLVYIDDLIEGMRLAACEPAAIGGTFVLAGPRAIRTDEMIARIANAVGTRVPRVRLPLWPLMAVSITMERTLQPLGIQPPLHRRRMNFFVKSFSFTCQEARTKLHYEPKIDFEVGATRTANWYRDRSLL